MRAREPGGARYSRLWRYAALSGADGVVVDSFNGWNEGTQIEPAAEAAEGCGGDGGGGEEKEAAASSSSSASATALGPQCAPDVRSYSEGENNNGGGLSSSSSSSSSGGGDGREERSKSKSRQQQRLKATPHLYMRLTASESARAAAVASRASGRIGYELPRALPSQLEARGGSRRGAGGGRTSE